MRYSQLQKDFDISNDLFNYHLQFLVKKGFLLKNKNNYSLSSLGIKLVADFNVSDIGVSNHLFKFNVILILIRRNKKNIEVLSQLRKSNPSYGKVGVPGGVIRKSESVLLAAKRKLKVETGLDCDSFRIVGMERRILYKDNQLFSDIIFPIVYSDKYSGVLLADSEFGNNMWIPINKAIKNESDPNDSIFSINKILKAIKNKKITSLKFFFNEVIQEDKRKITQ